MIVGKFNLLVCGLLILISCGRTNRKSDENPLAKVYDIYLYPSDLSDHLPKGISPEDSIKITRRMVEEWTRERLLLNRAEEYLSAAEKNIDKQIEEYRLSLLTFKYKQYLLAQNLDTIISNEEIQNYYQEYSSNYILNTDIVKATFIKVPVNAPQINQVRSWYKSSNVDDIDQLEKYCINYANKYIIKGENWIRFTELIKEVPLKISNPGKYLDNISNIEVNDSTYYYFIHIYERIPESNVSPIELVTHDIQTVILNKRKIEFIQDLEKSVYKDGLKRNQVEIF